MRHQFFAALVFILGVCRRSRPLRLAGLALLAALAVSQPVFAQSVPEVIEYYATDHLGSIRVVFDPNGTVLARSDYLPFGETYAQSGSLPRQRFTGQEHDDETGLEYFNARSLLARTGRFNRPDPLFAGAMGNPQGWNRYAYVGNNPLRFTDPTGAAAEKRPGNGINLWDDTECSAEHSLAQCGGMAMFWSSPADPYRDSAGVGFGNVYAYAQALGYVPGMPSDLWMGLLTIQSRAADSFNLARAEAAAAADGRTTVTAEWEVTLPEGDQGKPSVLDRAIPEIAKRTAPLTKPGFYLEFYGASALFPLAATAVEPIVTPLLGLYGQWMLFEASHPGTTMEVVDGAKELFGLEDGPPSSLGASAGALLRYLLTLPLNGTGRPLPRY